jgi:pimeloyl-ACP methyl ester carboxylesterase
MTTLLLHSSGHSGRQWRHLVKALPGPTRAPDLAGYSDGIPWQDGPAWEVDVAEILKLVDGIEGPIDLVGHSYGGAVALRVAARRPERIRRMVLHDPVVWGLLGEDGLGGVEETFAHLDLDRMLDEETGGSRAWLEMFIDFWNGPGAWAAMPSAHQQVLLGIGRKIFREVWDLFVARVSSSDFDSVVAPMRITIGSESPEAAQRVSRCLAKGDCRREVQLLPCGHMAPVTDPDLFNRSVVEFLGRSGLDGDRGRAR